MTTSDQNPQGRRPPPQPTIRIVHDLAELARSRQRLDILLADAPDATIFNSFEWIWCAYRTLHRDRRVCIVMLEDGQSLVALIPLTYGVELRNGLPLRTLRYAGFPLSDRVPLLVKPQFRDLLPQILDSLFFAGPRWDTIVLNETPADPSRFSEVRERAGRHRFPLLVRHVGRSPTLRLKFAGREQLTASYSSALRYRLKRSRKKLSAAGDVRFTRMQPQVNEVPRLLHEIAKVEALSWKGQQKRGLFSAPDRREFFSEVASSFARKGWLDIGLLHMNDALVSYRFGFRYRKCFLDYSSGYAPAYAELSPGRVLLDEMILSSLDLELDVVDASRGSLITGNLLADWTGEAVNHYDVSVYNTTPGGRTLHAIDAWLRPALKQWRHAGHRPSADDGRDGRTASGGCA